MKYARDVMSTPLLAVAEDASLSVTMHRFAEDGLHGAPVLSKDGELVGFLSASDLLCALDEQRLNPSTPRGEICVADLMETRVVTIPEHASLAEVVNLMRNANVHRAVVTHDGKAVGMVSSLDVLALIDDDEFDESDDPPRWSRPWREIAHYALRFDPRFFRAARDHRAALVPGSIAVILGGLARGFGDGRGEPAALILGAAFAVAAWLFASGAIAYLSRFFAPRPVALSQVLAPCAFAALPAWLFAIDALSLSAWIRIPAGVAIHLAMAAGFVIAVRETLRIGTARALALCLGTGLGGILVLVLLGILFVTPMAL